MFISLDHGEGVDTRDVIGFFDLETAGRSEATKNMFREHEKSFSVTTLCDDIPNSFLCVSNPYGETVIMSSHSVNTIKTRIFGASRFFKKGPAAQKGKEK